MTPALLRNHTPKVNLFCFQCVDGASLRVSRFLSCELWAELKLVGDFVNGATMAMAVAIAS